MACDDARLDVLEVVPVGQWFSEIDGRDGSEVAHEVDYLAVIYVHLMASGAL